MSPIPPPWYTIPMTKTQAPHTQLPLKIEALYQESLVTDDEKQLLVVNCSSPHLSFAESRANALFILDAFQTYRSSSMRPSELYAEVRRLTREQWAEEDRREEDADEYNNLLDSMREMAKGLRKAISTLSRHPGNFILVMELESTLKKSIKGITL